MIYRYGPMVCNDTFDLTGFRKRFASGGRGSSSPPDEDPEPDETEYLSLMGVNLEENVDWQRSYYFVNLLHSARWWETNGFSVNGWPTGNFKLLLITTDDVLEGVEQESFGSHPPDISGTYLIGFGGNCTIATTVGTIENQVYDSENNYTTAELIIPELDYDEWPNSLQLHFSDVNEEITDIKVHRPGYALNTTKVFTDEFIKVLRPFKVLRFMNLLNTNFADDDDEALERLSYLNGSTNDGLLDWNEKPNIDLELTYWSVFGTPIEILVALAKEANKDLWINIPHKATTDYVQNLAEYLHTEFASLDNKIYLEWSNELWNGIFVQFSDLQTEAENYVPDENNPDLDPLSNPAGNIYYEMRRLAFNKIAQVSNIFRTVFGDENMMTKIRPIFADQIGNIGMASDTLLWAQNSYPESPSYYIYALAGAPYYGASDGEVQDMLEEMADSINSRVTLDSEIEVGYYTIAQTYDIKYIGYEGGLDTGQGTVNLDNRIALSYDSRMEEITKSYLAQHYAGGSEFMCYFWLCSSFGKWGQWGLTDDVRTEAATDTGVNPKMKGAIKFATSDPRTFELGGISLIDGYYMQNTGGVLSNGVGLVGAYYEDSTFESLINSRIDPVIRFVWENYGTGMPYPTDDSTNVTSSFSVRWDGKVIPKYTETYTFTMMTPKGDTIYFYVNGQDMLDVNTIDLVAGQEYEITIWFRPSSGFNPEGIVRLLWSSESQQQCIIQRSQLLPPDNWSDEIYIPPTYDYIP